MKTSEDRVIELEFALREMTHQACGLIDLLKDMQSCEGASKKIVIGFLEQMVDIGTDTLLAEQEGKT